VRSTDTRIPKRTITESRKYAACLSIPQSPFRKCLSRSVLISSIQSSHSFESGETFLGGNVGSFSKWSSGIGPSLSRITLDIGSFRWFSEQVYGQRKTANKSPKPEVKKTIRGGWSLMPCGLSLHRTNIAIYETTARGRHIPWRLFHAPNQRRNMLTASKLRRLLSYSKSSGLMRWRVRPNSRIRIGSVAGCDHKGGTRKITIEGRSYLRNRLAVLAVTGRWPASNVNHMNGNLGDDRWRNLRVA
jgi:hypothetical protein